MSSYFRREFCTLPIVGVNRGVQSTKTRYLLTLVFVVVVVVVVFLSPLPLLIDLIFGARLIFFKGTDTAPPAWVYQS